MIPLSEPTLRHIGHADLLSYVEALAQAIEADAWHPDFLVGIGRGGLVPATYLSHRTDIPMLSVDQSSKVAGFADELLAKLAHQTMAGTRILFIDDINDSGATIAALRDTIRAQGGVADRLRVAVLIDNSRSIARVDYRARMIDRGIDKDWFVFPWEAVAPRIRLVEDAREVPERLG
jgi:hypoxanthine phosphoribosyltransferase